MPNYGIFPSYIALLSANHHDSIRQHTRSGSVSEANPRFQRPPESGTAWKMWIVKICHSYMRGKRIHIHWTHRTRMQTNQRINNHYPHRLADKPKTNTEIHNSRSKHHHHPQSTKWTACGHREARGKETVFILLSGLNTDPSFQCFGSVLVLYAYEYGYSLFHDPASNLN